MQIISVHVHYFCVKVNGILLKSCRTELNAFKWLLCIQIGF
jgi:hypothetical protein